MHRCQDVGRRILPTHVLCTYTYARIHTPAQTHARTNACIDAEMLLMYYYYYIVTPISLLLLLLLLLRLLLLLTTTIPLLAAAAAQQLASQPRPGPGPRPRAQAQGPGPGPRPRARLGAQAQGQDQGPGPSPGSGPRPAQSEQRAASSEHDHHHQYEVVLDIGLLEDEAARPRICLAPTDLCALPRREVAARGRLHAACVSERCAEAQAHTSHRRTAVGCRRGWWLALALAQAVQGMA